MCFLNYTRIYAEFIDTGLKYKNRCRSRISNLKDARNPLLRQRVLSGEISPDVFAQMTAEVSCVWFRVFKRYVTLPRG